MKSAKPKRDLTPQRIREMVQSGAWKMDFDHLNPGLTGTRAFQFRRRMTIAKEFVRSNKSLAELAAEAKTRKWSDRPVDRRAIHIVLCKAFRWLVEHGHLKRSQ
jgi:hypothetical protein